MSPDASQNFQNENVHELLASGFLFGWDNEKILLGWGAHKGLKTAPLSGTVFYAPDFYLEDSLPWFHFQNISLIDKKSLFDLLEKPAALPALDLRWKGPLKSEFIKQFEFVKSAINDGELTKAVPAVFSRASGTVTKSMRAKVLRQLLKPGSAAASVGLTPYGIWSSTSGIMGASPETLFNFNHQSRMAETMALAGTRNSEIESLNPLLNDLKERHEHQLVIDGLKEKLIQFGEPQVDSTKTWSLGRITHLRTDIRLKIANASRAIDDDKTTANELQELINHIHPTAALGVAPVSADWRILKNCEGSNDRHRFGAPFGVLNFCGESRFVVGIRNVQWNESGLFIGTGCGIVAQSDLDNEWSELELKQKYTHELLGL